MTTARIPATGAVLADRLRVADTHWTRLRGLLGTTGLEPGEGLWIVPCRQVHMFGMRYAIDVVFLDRDGVIVGTVAALAPGRVSPKFPGAASAVELPAGTLARTALEDGARVVIDGIDREAGGGLRWRRIAALVTNVALAAMWGFLALVHFSNARRTGNWLTTSPLVVQELLLVVLFLTRRQSLSTSERPFDWLVGVTGTFLPMCLRPSDTLSPMAWIGWPIQATGLLLSVVAMAYLGRSIGVVAANRGVKTEGLYAFVRHPMYAAHLTGHTGYVLVYPTTRNIAVLVLTFAALLARIRAEERFLSTDARYVAYIGRVRWRFIPYVY